MNTWLKVLVLVVPATLMTACGTTGGLKGKSGVTQPGTGAGTGMGTGTEATTDGISREGFGGPATSGSEFGSGVGQPVTQFDPLDDPDSLLSQRVVYFEYDSSNVKPEDRLVIEAHAQYVATSGARVTLEGHADERGTREYNIALGERRANAVRQMMSLLGVSSDQISTVSYGEERPMMLGHEDQSWQQNRRVEIVYEGR